MLSYVTNEDRPQDEEVDVEEFLTQIKSYSKFKSKKFMINKKDDSLLTFKCLFEEEHSNLRGANAYAFKRDGVYIAKCQGEVCYHSYEKLNRYLTKFAKLEFRYDLDDLPRLPFSDSPITVYKAPTGSGKTTKIIHEMMSALETEETIFIVLPSKTHIEELKKRFDDKTGDLEKAIKNKKLFVYTAETNDDNFKFNIASANVIITHHHYLKVRGHVGTKYAKIAEIYQKAERVIIDEGDRFLDLVHSNTLLVGGLYKENPRFDDTIIYSRNRKTLTKDEIEEEGLEYRTAILEPLLTSYQSIEFHARYELVDGLEYLDLVEAVRDRFHKLDDLYIENFHYEFYENQHAKELINKVMDHGDIYDAVDLALDYVTGATIVTNQGDELPRKQIGDMTLVLTYGSILDDLKEHERVMLTSATFTDYHYDLLDDYEIIEGHQKLKDVERIILLRGDKYRHTTKRQILDFATENDITALAFFGTKQVAEKLRKDYPLGSMFVDNGVYSVDKRQNLEDQLEQRTVTMIGLESVMSVGYNYVEEIQGEGFELLYFDKRPISPDYKKYYMHGNNIKQIKDSYNLNVYLQAIGRAFRTEKEELTIIFNEIEDKIYERLLEELRKITNAKLIESSYNKSNLKSSVYRHLERVAEEKGLSIERLCKAYLKNNKLIEERIRHGLLQIEEASEEGT